MRQGTTGTAGFAMRGARVLGIGSLLLDTAIIILLLAILGCVIYLVVKSVKNSKKGTPLSSAQGNIRQYDNVQTLKILDERFAKGEITDEEYKTKKDLILKH